MEKELQKLRNDLPQGAQKAIANKAGVKQHYVQQVLNGKINETEKSIEVLEVAVEYLKNYKARKKNVYSMLQQAAML